LSGLLQALYGLLLASLQRRVLQMAGRGEAVRTAIAGGGA
jgi:hypothetical protein